jgi:hypothetical protein
VLDLNFDPPQLPGIRVASQHHSSINQKLGGKAWLHSSKSNSQDSLTSVSGHTAVATVGGSNWSKHEAGNASNALYHEHEAATESHFKEARHIFDIRVIDASPSSAFENLALTNKKKPQSAFSRHSLPSIGSRDSFEGSFSFASDELASQRFSVLFSSQPYSSQHQISSNSGKSKSSVACTTNDEEEEEDEEDTNRGNHKPFIQSNLRHSVSFDCFDDHNEEEEERVIYESDTGKEDFQQQSHSRKFLKSPHPSALPPKQPTVSSAKRRVSARQGRYNNRVASRSLDPNDFSSNAQSNIRSNKITLDPLPQRPQMLQMPGSLPTGAANINPSDTAATMTVSCHPPRSNQDNPRVNSSSIPPLSAKKRTVTTSQRLSMDLTSNTSFTQ